MVEPTLPDEPSRRFLFVTGKGGVGKTTVTAALALALAARGKRVLAATCGAHERLSAMFGVASLDHEIREVSDNVWAVRLVPEHAMREYGLLVLKVRALAKAVFDNKYTHTFFRAVPGLYDWSLLGKAWYHAVEKVKTDRGMEDRFDVVIFDAPSTGHGLDMLRVPRVILDIVPPGILRRDAERAWEMFQDPRQSGVVVVSLGGDMPTTESLQLIEAVRGELGLPLARTIINAVDDPLFDQHQAEALLADPSLLAPRSESERDAPRQVLAVAAARAEREARHRRNRERLKTALDEQPLVLPRLLDGMATDERTAQLASVLGRDIHGF